MQAGRIDEKLEQLLRVIEQVHEHIIGERQVKNEDKLPSAHEPDIDAIVRGKTEADPPRTSRGCLSTLLAHGQIKGKLYEISKIAAIFSHR